MCLSTTDFIFFIKTFPFSSLFLYILIYGQPYCIYRTHIIIYDVKLLYFTVQEWVHKKLPLRPVVVVLDQNSKQIQVKNQLGHLLRVMDLTHNQMIEVYIVSDGVHIMFRVRNDYDLVCITKAYIKMKE